MITPDISQKQKDYYNQDTVWSKRINLNSGVGLEFFSNTKTISIDYKIIYSDRDWFYFDLVVNNKYIATYGEEPIETDGGTVRFDISGTRDYNHIILYFPHTISINISSIMISKDALIKYDYTKKEKILSLGDSIMQGMDAKHPINTYPIQYSRYWNMQLLNQAVGGLVFDLHTLDKHLSYSPDIIFVAYGTNDWDKCTGFSEYSQKVREYFQQLNRIFIDKKIFVFTPIWRKDFMVKKNTGFLDEIREEIVNACRLYKNMKIIDGRELVPEIKNLYDDRGIHPNDMGMLYYFINSLNKINKRGGKI